MLYTIYYISIERNFPLTFLKIWRFAIHPWTTNTGHFTYTISKRMRPCKCVIPRIIQEYKQQLGLFGFLYCEIHPRDNVSWHWQNKRWYSIMIIMIERTTRPPSVDKWSLRQFHSSAVLCNMNQSNSLEHTRLPPSPHSTSLLLVSNVHAVGTTIWQCRFRNGCFELFPRFDAVTITFRRGGGGHVVGIVCCCEMIARWFIIIIILILIVHDHAVSDGTMASGGSSSWSCRQGWWCWCCCRCHCRIPTSHNQRSRTEEGIIKFDVWKFYEGCKIVHIAPCDSTLFWFLGHGFESFLGCCHFMKVHAGVKVWGICCCRCCWWDRKSVV